MTKQQQKLLLISLVGVIASYMARPVITDAMQLLFYQPPVFRPKAAPKCHPKPRS